MTLPVSNINTNDFKNLISVSQKTNIPQTEVKAQEAQPQPLTEQNVPQIKPSIQDDIFDKINSKVINSKDITDTVTLPRCIFKGYLSFFAATALGTIGGMISKPKGLSNALKITSSVLGIVGTYEFLKPLIAKQTNNSKQA